MNSSNLKYYSQLDGLRAFAIVFVMVGHWISWDTTNEFVKHAPWGHGVILFFVLSGYLISNILFEQKEKIDSGFSTIGQSVKTFYLRRFLRIFPVYYLLIFYLYSINYQNTREIFPWLVTYTSNILEATTGEYVGNFNHFWSLAVEEQFYLIWPFVILFVDNKKIFKIILAFMAVSILSRFTCFIIEPKKWMLAAYLTPNLFLPLCLGALLAYARRYNTKLNTIFNNVILMYAATLVYILSYYFLHYQKQIAAYDILLDEYLFAIACLFFIARASCNGFQFIGKNILEHDIVVFLGKISYGLYVYHLFMGNFFWDYLANEHHIGLESKEAMWFIYFSLTILISILSFYFIEKPILKLKKYLEY